MPYQADSNQAEIVKALRDAGCSVEVIEGANGRKGVPDLLVGRTLHCGALLNAGPEMNFLLEVKRPKTKGRSAGKLDEKQQAWHAAWRGQVATVWTVEDALRAVGLLESGPR
jgi:hypothetical protein